MASNPPPAPARVVRTDNDRKVFALLRELRGSAQYLQGLASDALARSLEMDAGVRLAFLEREVPKSLVTRVDTQIAESLGAIEQLFSKDVTVHEWCADDVATIGLTWAGVKELWARVAPKPSFEDMQQRMTQVDAALDTIVYRCASLTLSPRVNDVLENLRIGQALDFDFEFETELPKAPKARKRLLLELAQQGGVFDAGVVDAERGVIYKAAAARREQRSSLWRIGLAILIGSIALPWIPVGILRPPSGEWSANLLRLFVDYVLLFVGGGLHLGIDALKLARTQSKPSFEPVGNWVLWLHVRETSILASVAWMCLGYVLLAVGFAHLEASSAFFAGYSIDSLTEVFLDRFQTRAKEAATTLTAPAKP